MALSEEEIKKNISRYKGWKYANGSISKTFVFSDFVVAFGFMTKVALIAEKMDHHPDWKNSYNSVEISLKTHSENGITQKDLSLAEEIEKLIAK